MAKPRHYTPVISRFIVSALYHEAKRLKIPMTRLTDTLLTQSLKNTHGWQEAETARVAEPPKSYGAKKAA